MGGRIAITLPTNIAKPLEYGFKDMASNGFQLGYIGRWYYGKRLTLGWDLAYQFQSGDDDYWNLDNRGEVEVSYNTLQVVAEGHYYFSHDNVRSYVGIGFGAFALMNKRVFSSFSEYTNPSGTYKYRKIMPGLTPQVGILIELDKKIMLDIHSRLVLMPNLADEYVTDEVLGQISTNPHGAQNHLSVSVGLLFGL